MNKKINEKWKMIVKANKKAFCNEFWFEKKKQVDESEYENALSYYEKLEDYLKDSDFNLKPTPINKLCYAVYCFYCNKKNPKDKEGKVKKQLLRLLVTNNKTFDLWWERIFDNEYLTEMRKPMWTDAGWLVEQMAIVATQPTPNKLTKKQLTNLKLFLLNQYKEIYESKLSEDNEQAAYWLLKPLLELI